MSYILVQQTEHLKAASRPKCRKAIPVLGLAASGVTSPLWAVTRMGESPVDSLGKATTDHRKRIYRNLLALPVILTPTRAHRIHYLNCLLLRSSLFFFIYTPSQNMVALLLHHPPSTFAFSLSTPSSSSSTTNTSRSARHLSPPSLPPGALYFSKIFFIICRKFFSHLFFCLPCPDQSSGASPSPSTQQT